MRFDHPVGKKIYNREFIDLPTHTRNNEECVEAALLWIKYQEKTAKKALRKKENEKFELECVFYLKIKKICFLLFSPYVILIEIAFF